MSGRAAALTAALLLAACTAGPGPRPPTLPSPSPPPPSPAPAARFFLSSSDQTFWVSRSPVLDRVIAGGARLELASTGEVTAAAWDADFAARGDPLVGGLAVPERLGGGFVLFSRTRVFRARELTGPLEPVSTGATGPVMVRGARAGLSSVVVVTDAGPRELLPGTMGAERSAAPSSAPKPPGSSRLAPMGEPGVLDFAATSARRAVRLDVFGRVMLTRDGGAAWTDLAPAAGLGVRQILTGGEGEVWIEGWRGTSRVGEDGQLEPGRPAGRNPQAPIQNVWKDARADRHAEWPWVLRETSPLAVTVGAGAALGDGTALGAVDGAVVRVDLGTGQLVSITLDAIPAGLLCQPLRAPDGVLFACVWRRSQGYGGYVLRSVDGGAPRVEKAFSDDGSFVAGDDGALGFVGSCQAAERVIDPSDPSRMASGDVVPLGPVLCVRRGPGSWVERRVDVGAGARLVAWVPRRDGTAVALAAATDPLPPPAGAPRVVEQGGVRLVRVYPELGAYAVRLAPWEPEHGGITGYVDRRFQARDDGSVDGWLLPVRDSGDRVALGVTFDPAGVPVAHPSAPEAVATVTGGAYAIAVARDGALHESTDHGRTWRPAGRSPVPPGWQAGVACSALGCTLDPVVRLGWGDGALAPSVTTAPFPPPPPGSPPRLVCDPRGAPVPLAAPPPAATGARRVVSTGWGETLEITGDTGAPEPLRSPGRRPGPPVRPRASPAVRRTQTLLVRSPFAPFAPPRRLDATDAAFDARGRVQAVPLLAPSGGVDLLLRGGDTTEVLVTGDTITALPAFDGRRYYGDGANQGGLTLPGGRALSLGEVRGRFALQDRGPGPLQPPLFLGPDGSRQRPRALARRDDGALGVLVLDGGAAATAGLAPLDRLAGIVRPAEPLAPWSAVLTADDPRCRAGADPQAWRALLVVDPAAWLTLDPRALPGVTLAHEGLLLVRWGRSHVCLEGLDAAADDAHRHGEASRSWHLVARWSGDRDRGVALRSPDLRQELVCHVAPAADAP